MPAGRYRSRTMRRVHVKTPGGKNTLHYKRRKPGKAQCGRCGKVLAGVPRELPYKMRNMTKTKKRPERPFGGVLCPTCSRKLIKSKARS